MSELKDTIERAVKVFETLRAAIQKDHSYAWSWHCNVATTLMADTGLSHEQANRDAAAFMQAAFEVDVRTFDEWKLFPWTNKTTI